MPPTSDPLTASERNALGTATNTATSISAALRILQTYQRSEAVSDEANARAESMMTTLRDQQGARSSTALGNAAFAQAQRLVAIAQTREDLAVAQRLLELAQQQQASPPPTPPTPGSQRPPSGEGSPSTPTWVWVTGGLVVVATVAVVGGIYVGRRQRVTAPPTPPEPRPDHARAPTPRSARRSQARAGNARP